MTAFATSTHQVSRLIRYSLVAILPPRNLKLSPSPIANYPPPSVSLMQAVKVFNCGKHVARRRKMLWVEEGRGESQEAGPS